MNQIATHLLFYTTYWKFNYLHCMNLGDWNLTLCQNLDTYNYLHGNTPRSKESVVKLIESHDLVDVWRIQHPKEKKPSLGDRAVHLNRAI